MEEDNQVRLQSIANTLLINIQYMSKNGLLDGKMGAVLFLYHFSRYTKEQFYEDLADLLLDTVAETIKMDTNPKSRESLFGVGLGIEYILSQRFVEGDSDELLEDFDKMLLSVEMNGTSPIISLYVSVRKNEIPFNLSQLIELRNVIKHPSVLDLPTKKTDYSLILPDLIWEGLSIFDRIICR